jgi:hypothetical protein
LLSLEDVTKYAGDSNEVLMVEFKEVDFLMSCPPYADLEKYSDDQRTYLTWTMLTSKSLLQ